MGVKISPDVAQAYMVEMLQGIPSECYMDDVGVWTNGSFKDHMAIIDRILQRFQQKNMKCNPLKCSWAVQETDFLGYWMTPTAIKTRKKRIEAIILLQDPKNNTNVRAFIGAVNHYKSLWPRRAHILAPLCELTGRGTLRWEPNHQHVFDAMKAIICSNALNTYQDYTKPFHIYTDASDLQLGAAIIQVHNNKPCPIAYYSKKLNSAQINYTTTEKELLAAVITFKEYSKILSGAVCFLYTDHKNLTFKIFSIQRVLRWRLYLDQFDCTLCYNQDDAETPRPIPCAAGVYQWDSWRSNE